MLGKIWKGLLATISKPVYKKKTQISEDVSTEVEVSLRECARKLEIAVHNMKHGSHEIVPEAQRFVVYKSNSEKLNPLHHLPLGELVWKMTFDDGRVDYYRAMDISIYGEYYVRRGETPLTKDWVEDEIKQQNIVSVGVISYNVPVRIFKVV